MTWAASFDVENWYDASLAGVSAAGSGEDVVGESAAVLDLLAVHDARATFFVLGEVAEAHPALIRRIAEGGHEIACHGWDHRPLTAHSASSLRTGLDRARGLLQDLSGQSVVGYRAPTWSLGGRTAWAVGCLVEAGFTYSSSVFPLRTPIYGCPAAPRVPFLLCTRGAEILEIPPAVAEGALGRWPVAGGIYWRLFPHAIVQRAFRASETPPVAYLHPWEISPFVQEGVRGVPVATRWTLTLGRRRGRRLLEALLAAGGAMRLDGLAVRTGREPVWDMGTEASG